MRKMIYPYRIVPIHDDTRIAWQGQAQYDTVCDANNALRAAGLINVFRADFVLSGELTDAQWTDLVVRESYEYSGFAVQKLRPGRDHLIPPYSIPFACDAWQRARYMMGRYRLPFTIPCECPYPNWVKLAYDDGRFDPAIIRSRNLAWGFFGTWCSNYVHQYDSDAWPELVGKVPPPSLAWARMVNDSFRLTPKKTSYPPASCSTTPRAGTCAKRSWFASPSTASRGRPQSTNTHSPRPPARVNCRTPPHTPPETSRRHHPSPAPKRAKTRSLECPSTVHGDPP